MPEHLTVDFRAEEPAYLVVSDTYYPGWQAELNGRPVPLLRANHAFRAVRVPAGSHRVEFVFRPHSLRLGLLLSALSIACLALFLIAASAPLVPRPTEWYNSGRPTH